MAVEVELWALVNMSGTAVPFSSREAAERMRATLPASERWELRRVAFDVPGRVGVTHSQRLCRCPLDDRCGACDG